jgi:hypothetical protein
MGWLSSKIQGALQSSGGIMTGPLGFDAARATIVPSVSAVTHPVHTGEGDMAVSTGVRSGDFEIEFLVAGEVGGAATFRWRRDGGYWQSSGGGGYATAADVNLTYDTGVPSGQHVQFLAGPGGGNDFEIGDTYAFTVSMAVTSNHQMVEVTIPLVQEPRETDTFNVNSTAFHATSIIETPAIRTATAGSAWSGNPCVSVIYQWEGGCSVTVKNQSFSSNWSGNAVLVVKALT